MGLVFDMVLQEMLEQKECMCGCKEYKKNLYAKNITPACQSCKIYKDVFFRVLSRLQNNIAVK